MSHSIKFYLDISYDKFLSVYKGDAKYVLTRSFDGRTIRFPADTIRPYLTKQGVSGTFEIFFDRQNKFKSLNKLS